MGYCRDSREGSSLTAVLSPIVDGGIASSFITNVMLELISDFDGSVGSITTTTWKMIYTLIY